MPEQDKGKKPATTPAQTTAKSIAVNAQYIKDISFECPKPSALYPNTSSPKIDVSIQVKAGALKPDSIFEVVLQFRVKATKDKDTFFVLELDYAGLFTLTAVPDQERGPVLFIFCPGLLFPFARRVIADITRDGGFPPLLLDPVDFARLYQKNMAETAKKGGTPEKTDKDRKDRKEA